MGYFDAIAVVNGHDQNRQADNKWSIIIDKWSMPLFLPKGILRAQYVYVKLVPV
jgi:hypothetical protein